LTYASLRLAGDTTDQEIPILVEAFKDKRVVQISVGSGHSVVLTDDGEVGAAARPLCLPAPAIERPTMGPAIRRPLP
jgi:hypothetical protein